MRRAPSITRTAMFLALLALAACEGDPAGFENGPRYVWVPEHAEVTAPDISSVSITTPGHAFAVGPPERAGMEQNALLFTDSTMRDTIGYVGSASLRATTPAGDPIQPGTAGSPPLAFTFEFDVKTEAFAARRLEREARESGARTRAGYAACASREPLAAWMAATARDDRSTADSLIAREACVVLRSGLPVAVLDSSAAGKARARVYAEEEALEVWIPAEAVAPGR